MSSFDHPPIARRPDAFRHGLLQLAEDPLSCAARRAGKALDDLELLKKVAIPP